MDKNVFRIDLCTLNNNSVGCNNDKSEHKGTELEKYVKEKGFECKLFESFGNNYQSGCGMLSSKVGQDAQEAGDSTIDAYNAAIQVLNDARNEYERLYL